VGLYGSGLTNMLLREYRVDFAGRGDDKDGSGCGSLMYNLRDFMCV
jgi:hypothetical protein